MRRMLRRCNLRAPLRNDARLGHLHLMSVGFKEWALICEALGHGEQSIILRKGGIAEGRAGFQFKYDDFFLFPTLFHEQIAQLKLLGASRLPEPRKDGMVEIQYRVRVEWTQQLDDLAVAERLAPFHLWQNSVIEERFRYDGKNALNLAFVRVAKLSSPFVFPDSPKFGGCRSWVDLPEPPAEITATEVLNEAEHHARESQIRSALRH